MDAQELDDPVEFEVLFVDALPILYNSVLWFCAKSKIGRTLTGAGKFSNSG